MTLARIGIHLRSKARTLRGYAYGLRQPVLLCEFDVTIPGGYDFAAMDQAMAPFFEETPATLETTPDPAGGALHRLLHWHAAVQRQQKIPVFESACVMPLAPAPENGRSFLVAVPYHVPAATVAALAWVQGALNDMLAVPDRPAGDTAQIREKFDRLLDKLQQYAAGGSNNYHLLTAAHRMDMPASPILAGTFRFGLGTHGRLLESTLTDRTPALGVKISHSKSKTAHLLRQHGLPTPQHAAATNAEQAVELANKLGYPVVIKPDDQEQGRGVEAGLRDDAAVTAAYVAARNHSKLILVEKHCEGNDYRLTVFRGRVVKILLRHPGGVVGDGSLTIAELLSIEQQTPRFQKKLRQTGKMLVDFDSEAMSLLAERGLSPQSIPAAGEAIPLRRKSNISAGGSQMLIPIADAHPDNLDLAIRATEVMCLDVSGVDLIIPDLSRSWMETGAVIVEMNAQPQIGVDYAPEVFQTILRELVGETGRVPLHLLICLDETDFPTREQALRLAQAANCNGVSMPSGIWINGRQLTNVAHTGFDSARILLCNPTLSAALCVMTAGDIMQNGLPADRFEKATIMGHQRANAQEQAMLKKMVDMIRGSSATSRSSISNRTS
ncbi:acetate--CoA ligase family protein [Emcibacter sp. SYSU 3D8]|uniref:acetate--CoA ligase family protein n=1 Tax=Emcibacter sp. SYSU 3D8 TaxID=3133969 RepID=UPI0031FF2E99